MLTPETDLIHKLQNFNFTQYEAKAYVALVGIGSAHANAVSKAAGIPRARIYDTLTSLIERGLAMVEEDGNGAKTYNALPVGCFLDQAKTAWSDNFAIVEKRLKEVEASAGNHEERYISVLSGREGGIAFCDNLIANAGKKLICSLSAEMYDCLEDKLAAAAGRGCRLAGIVFGRGSSLAGIEEHRDEGSHLSLGKRNWFIVSADNCRLVYGPTIGKETKIFYTDDPTHVFFLEDYIYHDIMLNRIEQTDPPKLRSQRRMQADDLIRLFSYEED